MPEPSPIEVELTRLSSLLLKVAKDLNDAAARIDGVAVTIGPVWMTDEAADEYYGRMLELAERVTRE